MRPPIALSIAGTDPSGGAGIQADLKTFTALGVYGTTVITALVAQNTHGVSRVYGIDDDFVADQLASVADDMPIDATKTGMLGTRSLVELVSRQARERDLGYLVVDPVMVATSGHRLLDEDAVDAVRTLLVPQADLITPNLPEAALLLGDDVPEATNPEQMRLQATELIGRGASAVLLKGGHLDSGELVDVLAVRRETSTGTGVDITEVAHPRLDTRHTHGTGCTLAAAITAHMAAARHAAPEAPAESHVVSAVENSLAYLNRAITSAAEWTIALQPEGAHGPVDHLVDLRAAHL
ncbi:bifunctional hydroxymethylpyrimidine kinase/phosphomethylpyrimidine kinase [Brevibacterium daeguense]|uniref:Bifunctional hydroxymethylpyrimidine kinase/phosphomethylpyrimidine kinase n=1 Tax=Brevibacterium daeguense TaxID=909936 RepID=A0ABP8EG33_9MICO|nr:bifunctional hydroxymethylpyrimidine kinase/phosphomethylpyrimidine kinase [Brevibacterium daeguense]